MVVVKLLFFLSLKKSPLHLTRLLLMTGRFPQLPAKLDLHQSESLNLNLLIVCVVLTI